jgi:gluconate 2-dehydrogenase gamma chain
MAARLMDDPYAARRRDFLKASTVAAAATAIACGGGTGRFRVLRDAEALTLGAACDQIVPKDEDPGASEAGVVAFIDRQLATRAKRELARWRAGIRGLDAASRSRFGVAFAEAAFDDQTALLRDLEKGAGDKGHWQSIAPAAFFRLLRDYTMMGFYGDPRHGGNRDRVSWRMLGVPDPPIRGRLHETEPAPALAPRPSRKS